MPKVSIVMPAFNAELWISSAVSSILQQDYEDFELIILNDGSTDQTGNILRKIRDRRVVNVSYQRNGGYSRRLNDGLLVSRGEFVARMDADDIAARTRLSSQLKHLHSNLSLKISATWTYHIDTEGAVRGEHRCPITHAAIAVYLLSNVTLIHHPTVMLHRSVIDVLSNYDENFEPAEDFEMWTRAVIANLNMGIIPDHQLFYRRHEGQVSSTRGAQQWAAGRRAVSNLLLTMSRGRLSADERELLFLLLAGPTLRQHSVGAREERRLVNGLLELRELLVQHIGVEVLDPFVHSLRLSLRRLSAQGQTTLSREIYSATMRGRPL